MPTDSVSPVSPSVRPEVEIDTALAGANDRLDRVNQEIHHALDSLHHVAGDRQQSPRRGVPASWGLTEAQVLAFEPTSRWEQDRKASARAELVSARERRGGIEAEIDELEAEYTGWTRFFIVPGGHIHRSTRCSTCHPTTLFGWLPLLSGLTERDAVEAHGPLLCSVCFPSAPREWTLGIKRDYCPGSDQPATVSGRSRYVRCPACAKTVAVTKYGQIRKHQPQSDHSRDATAKEAN